MGKTSTPLAKDDPMLIAWNKYKDSYEYKNSFIWARHEKHRDGSMWACFVAGYELASGILPVESIADRE